MTEAKAARATRALEAVVVVLSGAFVAAYLAVAVTRAGYPFELEWMEGGSLDHVFRILEGRPLYGPPSLEFTPFFYPPLYYYLAAGASLVVGPGFLALRLVSLAASLGCFALIARLVHRETRSAFAACAAVGLFAATYRHAGAWLDLGRGDSLMLLGLLAAATLLRDGGTAAHLAAAAAAAAAVFTKQTAIVPAVALGVFALWRDRRHGASYAITLLALVAGPGLAADRLHGGWLSYYTLTSSSRHPLVPRVFVTFFTRDLLAPLGIACVAAAFFFLRPAGTRDARALYAAFGSGMMLVALLSRANVGGYDNVLLPACVVLAILFGLGLHEARAASRDFPSLRVLVPAAVAAQLAGLAYDPSRQVPTRADRRAGEQVVALLAAESGAVFVPGHPYLLRLAGKPTHTHFVGINEILTHGTPPVRAAFAAELEGALAGRRYGLVVLDSPAWFRREMDGAYLDTGPVFDDPALFRPVTGARLRPERIHRPSGPAMAQDTR